MKCYAAGLPIQECERQAQGAIRLSEVYSSVPWHAQRAAKDPDYWNKFYDSRVNWWNGAGCGESSTGAS